MTTTTTAWAAQDSTGPLAPVTINRREVGADDVEIAVSHCGICHSDVHTVRNHWHATTYPCVPGHEIVGTVVSVGPSVSRFAAGDTVGVGCLVDSCGQCAECRDGLENYCRVGATMTYNSVDPTGTEPQTYGGYSARIVVREPFVLRIPAALPPASAAPILCAGITMFSPLRHHGVGDGSAVGIAGFGGLGSMGVKLAKAMGAEVVVITRSDRKAEDAMKAGADRVVVSTDRAALRSAYRSLDVVLSTIPTAHDVMPYLRLLKRDGAYVILGALEPLPQIHGGLLAANRVSVTGSMIGGLPETQELLDFCAEHGVTADIEVVGVDGINDAYAQIEAGDPGFRYVIDISTI
jgi:uncharacterized zinc-type alcohol dehydrogenase-like protein